MITPKTQYNLKNAREYFKEHLAHGDYYTEKQRVAGQWFGVAAEKIGLSGDIKEEDFLQLCEGLNPRTGERLTARMNTLREVGGIKMANRRVFFDFVFRPPKSVSLVALCSDARVIDLHNEAVRQGLAELERFAAARIRKGGAPRDAKRTTGNIVAALFCHDASRALDPLLHTHAVVFNATYDSEEQRWKALENSEMLKAQKLANAVYDAKLTAGLAGLGYRIRREGSSYEIETVTRPTIEKFSQRRRQIEAIAAAEAERVGPNANIFQIRDRVAHDHRARKIKDASAETLRDLWLGAMSADERAGLKPRNERIVVDKQAAVGEAVRIADGMIFERKSVVERRELEAAILHETLGSGATLAEIKPLLDTDRYVRALDSDEITSAASLRAEMDVIVMARDGRNTREAINVGFDVVATRLDAEQQLAARQILGNRDFVTLFRGAAGTGKSFTLKVVGDAVQSAGKGLVVIAPGTKQVVALQKDGLPAVTVARFLMEGRLTPGAVVLLDEAGQVGARQMRAVMELVHGAGGRLILSGDTRQHGAVEASDALLAIERFAHLQPAIVKTIRRQDPGRALDAAEAARIEAYRQAVFAASEGDIGQSFSRLEKLGAVQKVKEEERIQAVANAVVDELAAAVDVLAVSQTRADTAAVNEAVTDAAIARGLVKNSRAIEVFVPRDSTAIEKTLARSYAVGDEVLFVARYGANKPGDVRRIVHVGVDAIIVDGGEKGRRLSLKYGERWNVVDRQLVTLGEGSRVQMKLNGVSAEGRRVANGELCTVRRIQDNGRIVLEDDHGATKTLKEHQRVMLPGYCVTSYAAQGQSVESVILADSGSRLATHQKEWYVSISRAKRRIKVFTSDVKGLRERIGASGEDKLAMELKARKSKKTRNRPPLTAAQRLRLAQRLGARVARKMAQVVKQKGPRLGHQVVKVIKPKGTSWRHRP